MSQNPPESPPLVTDTHDDADTKCLDVGALRLNVARLLTLVANFLATAGILRAVAREVSTLTTVVALGAIDAVA